MGVTREDVAKLAGVSGTTVSYVMNNTKHITPEVRKRVFEAAQQLNYHPSLVARGLVTKETRHIAMLVNSVQNPYYTGILEGVQNVADQEGYIVSVLSMRTSLTKNMSALISRGIDGIIIAASTVTAFKELLKPNSPMAYVSETLAISFYRQAIFDMVKAFHQLGHRRIAFLSGLSLQNPAHYRYHDFNDALKNYDMEIVPELFIDGDGTTEEISGYKAADTLLRRNVPFTGVFATNDLMAIGAMKRFWEEGLRIPQDVSIAGCDGIMTTGYTIPPLSTLHSHAFSLGTYLMYQLLEKMQSDRTFPYPDQEVQAEFIQRESMGPAQKLDAHLPA